MTGAADGAVTGAAFDDGTGSIGGVFALGRAAGVSCGAALACVPAPGDGATGDGAAGRSSRYPVAPASARQVTVSGNSKRFERGPPGAGVAMKGDAVAGPRTATLSLA